MLMGAVARTYTPGEKHDEMVILVGPQSLGKSTIWAWLLPPADRRSWFSDALKFHSDLKAQVEALQGRVLVEAAEMSGSTRAEVESIKGFLATTRRRRRPAYLPPRPYRPSPPLHHRRLDQRPPLSPERPLWEPPLCAGPGNGRGPSQDPDVSSTNIGAQAAVGRGDGIDRSCSKSRRGCPTS